MDPRAALERLEALLVEEREAIRSLDSERVALAAAEKENLLTIFVGAKADEKKALAPRLGDLVPKLRHNGVLLAHARDCLRDALAALGQRPFNESLRMAPTVRPGLRLSVTG